MDHGKIKIRGYIRRSLGNLDLLYRPSVTHYRGTWLHPLDKLLRLIDRLLLGPQEVFSFPGCTGPSPSASPHRSCTPDPDHLKGPPLILLPFIITFLIFEVEQENRTLVGLTTAE